MNGLEHPLTGDRYEIDDQGVVTVYQRPALQGTEPEGSPTGRFDGHGRWLSGPVKVADPALCVWLASAPARASKPTTTPSTTLSSDSSAPTGSPTEAAS